MMKYLRIVAMILVAFASANVMGQRKFVHPGITFTQADIDRMKVMYENKVEPFYSGFLALRDDNFYTRYRDITRPFPTASNGEPVIWDNPNLWLDGFGQIALNNALVWLITGDTYYADRAVTVLNRYKNIHSVKPYGTYPLDASKAMALIEGAELMRSYPGWKAEDQQAFKDFLVYPGYTTKEDYYAKYSNADTIQNKVTIYWNIYQGDPGRHGNQGLYAMRCMLEMGIFLDNDTIYDRAYRKMLSLGHRPDDLAYPYGPRSGREKTSPMPAFYRCWGQNPKYDHLVIGDIVDYGSDDEIKYWIYENGQCQEAARDQGHIMDGMVSVVNAAKVAWNQGDDMFTAYDDRILKGLNYAAHYNYGWNNNHWQKEAYWQGEPDFEPTVENGQFLQRMSRNNAFLSLKINPYHESDSTWSRGDRFYDPVPALMSYKVRLGRSPEEILWVQRAYDMDVDSLNHAGKALASYLTDYRTVWMAGDGVSFASGSRVSGLHRMPGTISAVDYDYFNEMVSGEGRTWYNGGNKRTDDLYRPEGGMPVKKDGDDYVLTQLADSAWVNYSISASKAGWYDVKVLAKVSKTVNLGYAVDGSRKKDVGVGTTNGYETIDLGKVRLMAGAQVLRIYIGGAADAVDMKSISLEETTSSDEIADYEWNSRDYMPTSNGGVFRTDESDTNLYSVSYSSTTQPVFTLSSGQMSYRIPTKNKYMVMVGKNISYATLKGTTYKLSDTSSDVSKTTTSGACHKTVKLEDGSVALVWKLDSTVNKRIKPLFNDCYASTNDSYILRKLSLNVSGVSLHKSVSIDGLYFCSAEDVEKFAPTTGISIVDCESSEAKEDNHIYDLQGRWVQHPAHGIYIKNKKKYVIR